MSRKHGTTFIVLALTTVMAFATIGAAHAAKGGSAGKQGGGGGGHKGSTTGSGTFNLVLLNSTDGVAHYGQDVTYNVSASVTYPWVRLDCYQGTTWVFGQDVGFYAAYPWSKVFTLTSYLWPSGAADCSARLFDGSTDATLSTMTFHVYE